MEAVHYFAKPPPPLYAVKTALLVACYTALTDDVAQKGETLADLETHLGHSNRPWRPLVED